MATAPVTLDQQKQQLRLLWMAMFGGVAMYGAACFFVLGAASTAADDTPNQLHNVFTVVGIILGALSIWWRRHFLSSDPAPAGADVGMEFIRFQAHSLTVWALSDAVAACGLVLALVVRSFQEFVPFGVAGAALLVMHHPFRLPYDRLRPAVS
jgi:hypothetical protein